MPPKSGPKSKRGSNSSSKKQPKTVKDARKTPKASASSSSSNSSRGSQDPLFVAPVEAQTVTRGIGSGRRRDIRVAAVPTQRFEPHAEGNESSSLSSVRDHERQSSDRPPSRTPLPLSFTFTGEDLRIEGDNVVEVDRSDVMTIFYNEDGISSASHTVTTKYKMGPPSSTESDLSLSRSQRSAVLSNSSTSRRPSFVPIVGKNVRIEGMNVVEMSRSSSLKIKEKYSLPFAFASVTVIYRLDPSPSSPPPMADPEDPDDDGDDDDDQEEREEIIEEEDQDQDQGRVREDQRATRSSTLSSRRTGPRLSQTITGRQSSGWKYNRNPVEILKVLPKSSLLLSDLTSAVSFGPSSGVFSVRYCVINGYHKRRSSFEMGQRSSVVVNFPRSSKNPINAEVITTRDRSTTQENIPVDRAIANAILVAKQMECPLLFNSPVEDSEDEDQDLIIRNFYWAVAIFQLLKSEDRPFEMLVHCKAGQCRSVVTVIAILVSHGKSLEDAMTIVARKVHVFMRDKFEDALARFEALCAMP